MTHAYRDDLDAARARVSDLEREAERLRTRNAELTATNRDEIEPRAMPEPVQPAAPSALEKAMTVLTKICFIVALVAVAPPKYSWMEYTPHVGIAAIGGALGLVFWCLSGFHPLWKRR